MKPPPYPPRTEAELTELAHDLHSGLVYCDKHKWGVEPFRSFLSTLDGKEGFAAMVRRWNVGLCYEYLTHAQRILPNGMPTFLTLRLLDQQDAQIMWGFFDEVRRIRERRSN